MTNNKKPTLEELREYGKNMEMTAKLESKLEDYSEESSINGFQLVSISLEDLYASNWDAIQLEREFEWEDYKRVEELSEDHGYGRTLYPEEAKYLIDMFEEEGPKEYFVGLVCEGVVVNSIE